MEPKALYKRTPEKYLTETLFQDHCLFEAERKIRKERAVNTTGEINSENRHCLRGLDGKCGRWDEILRDFQNSKLKTVQRKNRQKVTPMMMMTMKKYRKKPERQK